MKSIRTLAVDSFHSWHIGYFSRPFQSEKMILYVNELLIWLVPFLNAKAS
jgi:hypothetical protein